MTIGERIKEIRKHEKLTQAEFADRIGLKPTAVLMYEKGSRNVTEQSIALICMEFHVNEKWLRTGEGAMFERTDASLLDRLAAEHGLDDAQKAMVGNFLSLSNEYRAAIVHIVKALAEGAAQPAPAVTPEDMATYEKVKAQLAADPLSPEAPLSEEERELIQRMRLEKESSARTAG